MVVKYNGACDGNELCRKVNVGKFVLYGKCKFSTGSELKIAQILPDIARAMEFDE